MLRAFTAVATGGAAAAAANAETEFHHERNLALFSFPPFDCLNPAPNSSMSIYLNFLCRETVHPGQIMINRRWTGSLKKRNKEPDTMRFSPHRFAMSDKGRTEPYKGSPAHSMKGSTL